MVFAKRAKNYLMNKCECARDCMRVWIWIINLEWKKKAARQKQQEKKRRYSVGCWLSQSATHFEVSAEDLHSIQCAFVWNKDFGSTIVHPMNFN